MLPPGRPGVLQVQVPAQVDDGVQAAVAGVGVDGRAPAAQYVVWGGVHTSSFGGVGVGVGVDVGIEEVVVDCG